MLLFFNADARVVSISTFGPGNGTIWASNVLCTGEEERLIDCSHNTETASCTHSNDAAIQCNQTGGDPYVIFNDPCMFFYKRILLIINLVLCNNGDLRLVDGPVPHVGRVEICWNEIWGTICDGFWSTFDANVACRQLGYPPYGMIQ